MNAVVEIMIALFVFFAVFSLLRGNWAGFFASVAGALTLGLLAGMSSHDDERDRGHS
jgi:hypothetical protein